MILVMKMLTIWFLGSVMAGLGICYEQSITCDSLKYQRTECQLNNVYNRIVKTKQLSRSTCTQDISFGLEGNIVWVDKGYRATFNVTFTDEFLVSEPVLCNPVSNNYTAEELWAKIQELNKQLRLNKKILSSYTRRRISANDTRMSSRVIGCGGAVTLVLIVGVIVSTDVLSLHRYIRKVFTKRPRTKVCPSDTFHRNTSEVVIMGK